MPSEASGTAVYSFGVESFSTPNSTIAEGAVTDSFTIVDIRSPPSSPPGAAIGSPMCSRALGDSRMWSTGISTALGPVSGCCSV